MIKIGIVGSDNTPAARFSEITNLKNPPGGLQVDGLKVFLNMIRPGKRPLSNEQLLLPVRLLEAIELSLTKGGDVLL